MEEENAVPSPWVYEVEDASYTPVEKKTTSSDQPSNPKRHRGDHWSDPDCESWADVLERERGSSDERKKYFMICEEHSFICVSVSEYKSIV